MVESVDPFCDSREALDLKAIHDCPGGPIDRRCAPFHDFSLAHAGGRGGRLRIARVDRSRSAMVGQKCRRGARTIEYRAADRECQLPRGHRAALGSNLLSPGGGRFTRDSIGGGSERQSRHGQTARAGEVACDGRRSRSDALHVLEHAVARHDVRSPERVAGNHGQQARHHAHRRRASPGPRRGNAIHLARERLADVSLRQSSRPVHRRSRFPSRSRLVCRIWPAGSRDRRRHRCDGRGQRELREPC